MTLKKTLLLLPACVLSLGAAVAVAQSGDDDEAKQDAEIVAAQVRDQGYTCDNPVKADRDRDKDGDAVWTLHCANASYLVRLIPDMAAHIDQID